MQEGKGLGSKSTRVRTLGAGVVVVSAKLRSLGLLNPYCKIGQIHLSAVQEELPEWWCVITWEDGHPAHVERGRALHKAHTQMAGGRLLQEEARFMLLQSPLFHTGI